MVNTKPAFRLVSILTRLNSGESLDVLQPADYKVSECAISRDFSHFGSLLEWAEAKYPYYRFNLVIQNVNEIDITPLVQYWMPYLVVISLENENSNGREIATICGKHELKIFINN